jgi:tetratricopeptide (TPR) repeat protein
MIERMKKLQAVLDAQIGKENIHNLVAAVQSDDQSIDFVGAAGIADPQTGAAMTPETSYFIASVTKMYTAAIIMQLHDEKCVDLDSPISQYLPASLTRGIHIYKGTDYSERIKVSELVNQSSGLADHEIDKPRGGKSVFDELKAGHDRSIDTAEAIEIVRGLSPHFPPGTHGKAYYSNMREPTSFAVNGLRAGVLAVARVLAVVYAFAAYKKVWGNVLEKSTEEAELSTPSTSPGDGLVKASIGFTFASFLPLFHLIALVLGIIALRSKRQFVLGPVIACCAGGFFTILYFLLITGWILGASVPSSAPTYEFLTDVNPELKPQVTLLEQGSYQEIQQQLGQTGTESSKRHWAVDCASALAKYQSYDLEGALKDFGIAAKKNPERSEFYYFYGIALLENGQDKLAVEQFQNALRHEPRLAAADRYLDLINSTYTPSIIVSSLGFVIILLLSFTLHEYGHALAAWKLGDDTAKNQGRLTLNPIPHLDLFGSLILPAILLFQQSEVMFG